LLESSKVETSAEDLKKKAVEQRKFQADLLRLHEETLKAQEAATSSYAEKRASIYSRDAYRKKKKYALKSKKKISQKRHANSKRKERRACRA
jgi:hypothetical protein